MAAVSHLFRSETIPRREGRREKAREGKRKRGREGETEGGREGERGEGGME